MSDPIREEAIAALDDSIYDAAVLRTESVRISARNARAIRAALSTTPAPDPLTPDDIADWLRRSDGRIEDIFGLWVQGKRDGRWVGERLIEEGHLDALIGAPHDQ